jgi:hypothetical protein
VVPDVLQHRRQWKYVKYYEKEWFYNAEPLCENFLYNTHKKKRNFFPLNIFKPYITIYDIMFFANKNKVNSIPLS